MKKKHSFKLQEFLRGWFGFYTCCTESTVQKLKIQFRKN